MKLIILDEMSMLGSKTFDQINRRLQQIFHTDKAFAGISIIVIVHNLSGYLHVYDFANY